MIGARWAKQLLGSAVAAVPFEVQRRATRAKLFLPFYHVVSDAPVPHFSHNVAHYPGVRAFEQDLDFFLQRFEPIDLHALIAHLHEGSALPRRAMLLSFDDGYREAYEVVMPVLLRKGVPATFFVNTSSLDNRRLLFSNKRSALLELLKQKGLSDSPEFAHVPRLRFFEESQLDRVCANLGFDSLAYLAEHRPYLTSIQLKELVQHGFTIGSHSADHPPYHLLGIEDQVRQTLDSLDALKTAFAITYSAFAFPGGDDGVSAEFFRRIRGLVSVSFGTSAGFEDGIANHLQRTGFESSGAPASRVLAERYAVELIRRVTRRNQKSRPA